MLFLSVTSLRAQTTEIEGYTIRHFTDENGLPQNSVKSIAADNAGFVWLATENGLVRFDGRSFKVMDHILPSALENRIALFIQLWIGPKSA